jgi:hypothetical protein
LLPSILETFRNWFESIWTKFEEVMEEIRKQKKEMKEKKKKRKK